jgi:hypothetical protein
MNVDNSPRYATTAGSLLGQQQPFVRAASARSYVDWRFIDRRGDVSNTFCQINGRVRSDPALTLMNSLGRAFVQPIWRPSDLIGHYKLAEGDTVYLTETADGFRLTRYNPEFEAQLTAARKIIKKRRAALRELAK